MNLILLFITYSIILLGNKTTLSILVIEISWFHGISLEFTHDEFASMVDKYLVLEDVQLVYKSQLSR